MALIHARLASKKADPFPFSNYMQLALFVRRLTSMACMEHTLATSMCPAMASSNFPIGTPLIYLSMMIQGDDGYGEMVGYSHDDEETATVGKPLGQFSVWSLVFAGLHRW